MWNQPCSLGFALWDLWPGAISAAGRRWYLGTVAVRCPQTASPGLDISFRLLVRAPPLTHLSGGQHAPRGDLGVSLEAGAGLRSGQPWEVQAWLGVAVCARMSWSRSPDFCSRAECLGCSCPGWSGLRLQQVSLPLSRTVPAGSPNCPLLPCTVYSQWL